MKYSVYVLIKNNTVIYIGCTTNLKSRMNGHKRVRDFDSYSEVYYTYKKTDALQFERHFTVITDTFTSFCLQNIDATSKINHLKNRFKIIPIKRNKRKEHTNG